MATRRVLARSPSPAHLLLLVIFSCLIGHSHQEEGENANSLPAVENAIQENAAVKAPIQTDSRFTFDDTILYKINWAKSHQSESDVVNKSVAESSDKIDGEEVFINSPNNEQYRCVIPSVDKEAQLNSESSKDADLNPYELIRPVFTKKFCAYRVENYWTYEICHGRYIRQFHEDPRSRQEGVAQEYYLGKFDLKQLDKLSKNYEENERGKKRPTVTVEDLTLPFIEVNFTDGSLCDLSSKKRFTRVLYVCLEEGNHDLYSIKETSTCEYEVVSFSPLLCKSSEFKLKTAVENEIKCYPMNAQTPAVPVGYELDRIQKEKEKEKEQLKSLKEEKNELGSIFEGKRISIETDSTGQGIRIKIVPESENKRAFTQIARQFLTGEYCLTGGSGWWKYEFCYGKKVDQYHEEKNGKKVSINLGNWDLKEHVKWLEANPSKRPKAGKTPKQVSHFYSYGEACDLTKKPRTVEVKLKCGSSANSESVTIYLMEPKTCEYVLGVESSIICELLSTVDENGLFVISPASDESSMSSSSSSLSSSAELFDDDESKD